ncbi:MAG: RNA polymerase factor sigma-32 [Deltaproteobacteria bacterium]|nr:RNA polymerase factor sigma-32 [Deltaproteobacteria bacterium]
MSGSDKNTGVRGVSEAEEPTEGELITGGNTLDELEFAERHDHAETSKKAPQRALVRPGQRSLALRDPLQAYINEARRYPLLDREEERELALKYCKNGDLDAARHLVTSNLRLVVKIAHEYRKAARNVLDLVQEGNIGLMHAVKKFDPHRGVKLSSYAAWWIRAYILKYILNNWRMVKIGTTQHQRKLFFNLRKEMERLRQEGVDSPGPKLIAERLDVPEHEVRSMQERLSGGDVSLDAPVGGEESGSASRVDFVPGSDPGPEAQVEEAQFSHIVREKVAEFGETLAGRDREIFELRTVSEEPLTLQQIGDRYGITRERARQIERRVMDRLRDYLREELKDSVEIALGTSGEK